MGSQQEQIPVQWEKAHEELGTNGGEQVGHELSVLSSRLVNGGGLGTAGWPLRTIAGRREQT